MADNNNLKAYDEVLRSIITYAFEYEAPSSTAWVNAKAALVDSLGCAIESLETSKECAAMVGPVWAGAPVAPTGFKLPGTNFQLDPLKGAFDLGSMIRYLDHNDAFPGAEWGHPSVADSLGRNGSSPTVRTVLIALIKAYEIQGCFQIKNAFNKVGLDHTILVKVASTAVISWMLGLSVEQALSALSHAWMDGHPLRTYRQAPNTGPRKGWAAGDACMRAVHLALLAKSGQPGAPTVLTATKWGFYDTCFGSKSFELPRPFACWTMENIIFKVNTAEGHALSAVEAALEAHILVRTQEAAMIIINKEGPLHNPADRDHCMQYMVATVLIKGEMIDTNDYQNESIFAQDERIKLLQSKIRMVEDPQFTSDYHDPEIRGVANAVLVTLKDGSQLPEVVVQFPLGHPKRVDTVAAVRAKSRRNLALKLSQSRVDEIMRVSGDDDFENMPDSFLSPVRTSTIGKDATLDAADRHGPSLGSGLCQADVDMGDNKGGPNRDKPSRVSTMSLLRRDSVPPGADRTRDGLPMQAEMPRFPSRMLSTPGALL
ncbi:hypothetical protein B7494_g549 [Chlorociboria aeruginascens]|nr:hypothetical protein B7494_g549 [Chlorociboria aeruginascens]